MKKYLRTTLATNWPAPSTKMPTKLMQYIVSKITSNPDYEGVMHSVAEWLIEFDSDGNPGRELGLNAEGTVIIKGPDERNYGFWLDTNMKREDFVGSELHCSEFERHWNMDDAAA